MHCVAGHFPAFSVELITAPSSNAATHDPITPGIRGKGDGGGDVGGGGGCRGGSGAGGGKGLCECPDRHAAKSSVTTVVGALLSIRSLASEAPV